jgi:hypothetical protein
MPVASAWALLVPVDGCERRRDTDGKIACDDERKTKQGLGIRTSCHRESS